ncbi:hypothetical protein, partial [Morganella morganii]
RAVSNNEMQMSDCNAPVRARQVTEPYRRILKTPGYAGGYLFYTSYYGNYLLHHYSCLFP